MMTVLSIAARRGLWAWITAVPMATVTPSMRLTGFQQLSPWVGTLNGTGWTFDSGINFDAGRNFDEVGYSATLGLATTTFTVTNNGNLPTTAVSIEVTAGSRR